MTVSASCHPLLISAGEWDLIREHAEYICDNLLSHLSVVQSGTQVALPLPRHVEPPNGVLVSGAGQGEASAEHTDGAGNRFTFGTVECGAGGMFRLVHDTELHVGVAPSASAPVAAVTPHALPSGNAVAAAAAVHPHELQATPGTQFSASNQRSIEQVFECHVHCRVMCRGGQGGEGGVKTYDEEWLCCQPILSADANAKHTEPESSSTRTAESEALGGFALLRFKNTSLTLPLAAPVQLGALPDRTRFQIPLFAARSLIAQGSEAPAGSKGIWALEGSSVVKAVHMPPSSMLAARQLLPAAGTAAGAGAASEGVLDARAWTRRNVARAAHVLMGGWSPSSVICAAVSKAVFYVPHPSEESRNTFIQILCSEPPEAGAGVAVEATDPLGSLAIGPPLHTPSFGALRARHFGAGAMGNVVDVSRGLSTAATAAVLQCGASVLQRVEGGVSDGQPIIVHATAMNVQAQADTAACVHALSAVLSALFRDARRRGVGVPAWCTSHAPGSSISIPANELMTTASLPSSGNAGAAYVPVGCVTGGAVSSWGHMTVDAGALSSRQGTQEQPPSDEGKDAGIQAVQAEQQLVVLRAELLQSAPMDDSTGYSPAAAAALESLQQVLTARRNARLVQAAAATSGARVVFCVHDTPLSLGAPLPAWGSSAGVLPVFLSVPAPEHATSTEAETETHTCSEVSESVLQQAVAAVEQASARCCPDPIRDSALEAVFPAVGGLWGAKRELYDCLLLPIRWPRLLSGGGTLPRGVLIHGPSGCGKSLLAGSLAAAAGLPVVEVACSSLLDKYVGGSEAAVRRVWAQAQEQAPCVLVLDDVDAIAPQRGGGVGDAGTGVTDRMVNQLLTLLDGVDSNTGGGAGAAADSTAPLKQVQARVLSVLCDAVGFVPAPEHNTNTAAQTTDSSTASAMNSPLRDVFVVALTSRPDIVDAALKRPGRLDRHVQVQPPKSTERGDIMKCCLIQALRSGAWSGLRPDAAAAAVSWAVSSQAEGVTGADIQGVVTSASLLAEEHRTQSEHAVEAALLDEHAPVLSMDLMRQALQGVSNRDNPPSTGNGGGHRLGTAAEQGNSDAAKHTRAHAASKSAVVLA